MTENYVFSKNSNLMPSTEGHLINGSKYQLLGQSFASGSFGKLHVGQHVVTGELVAAKLVPKDNKSVQLESEYLFYQMLGQTQGIPKIYYFGEYERHHVLVMELLGPSFEKVFHECDYKFSVSTTTRLALQLIDLMEYLHSKRLIFRNVKPENFCLGRPNTPNANQLYLIGLIHANIYTNESHEHIPKIKGIPFAGTPRYMSLMAHKGKEQSRRDDLESIGHMLLYFVKGRLPWQGLNAGNDTEKYDKIYRVKKDTPLEDLCDELPNEFYHYMLYVRTLKFANDPNYEYLRQMFIKLMERLEIEMNDKYDWEEKRLFSENNQLNNTQRISIKKTVSFDIK